MSTYMKYEESVLTELSDQLIQFGKDLVAESGNFHTAAGKLGQAWDGNSGLAAFQASVKKWDTQFGQEGDTGPSTAIGMINSLARAVQTALANAKAADTGVQNAFSKYE
ncbi:hypothetical protein KO481_27200 [Nocardia sp. NEAU-G5]|uniref:WXG100 family type VII secretion target n=1 Tax=Nocardia albiluteola TaxID=2842303 RepID=A0ABS6B720_9NOCA|nr:hypothetical protein [Nocardia albiluteola]MBU3065201.1 hypothetical protein [Nocardia albiluteola]